MASEKQVPTTVQCPCGSIVTLDTEEILLTECEKCGRIAAHGCGKTGEIYSWMTVNQVDGAKRNMGIKVL